MFKSHTCTNIISSEASLYTHVILSTPIFRGQFNNEWNKFSICMNVNKFHLICGGVLLHLKYALDPYVLSLMWSWITICTHPPTRGTLPTHKPKQHVQTQAERKRDSPEVNCFYYQFPVAVPLPDAHPFYAGANNSERHSKWRQPVKNFIISIHSSSDIVIAGTISVLPTRQT